MNRNSAVVLIIAIVAAAAIGIYVYREQHKNSVEIQVGPNGIKVQGPSN